MSSRNHFAFKKPEYFIRKQDQLFEKENKPIKIEEDVWIGVGAFINAGVTIGRGAVIGAGSIVTKSISPYTVVAGNPAKPIKKRLDFSPNEKITSKNENNWPYFYNGFNHLEEVEKIKSNGFLMIDKSCIIKMKIPIEAEKLIVKGSSKKPSELVLKLKGIEHKETIRNAFKIEVSKPESVSGLTDLIFMQNQRNSIRIIEVLTS